MIVDMGMGSLSPMMAGLHGSRLRHGDRKDRHGTIKRAAMMARDRRKTECSKPTAGFVSRQHGPDKPRHALRPSGPRNDERLRTGVTSKRRPDDGTRFVCSSAARAVTCRRRSFGPMPAKLDIRSRGGRPSRTQACPLLTRPPLTAAAGRQACRERRQGEAPPFRRA